MLSYGVYILTSQAEDVYCGAMLAWVNQTSFEPPMISVFIKQSSLLYQVVKKKGEFLLHLLGDYNPPLAASFFRPTSIEGGCINGYEFTLTHSFLLIQDVLAFLYCWMIDVLENRDRLVFLAEVKNVVFQYDPELLELRSTCWSDGWQLYCLHG